MKNQLPTCIYCFETCVLLPSSLFDFLGTNRKMCCGMRQPQRMFDVEMSYSEGRPWRSVSIELSVQLNPAFLIAEMG